MIKFLIQRPIAVLMAFTACFHHRAGDILYAAYITASQYRYS